MKKNKGFTLIELLAVIIVLAIIALIATPIVMNTIKNSKKNSALISGQEYIKQVGTTVMQNRLETGHFIKDGTYTINSDGNLTGNGLEEPFEIPMSGKKPSSGTIKIENGQVKEDSLYMIIDNYEVEYDENDSNYIAGEFDISQPDYLNAVKYSERFISNSKFLEGPIAKDRIESIEFMTSSEVPSDAIGSWVVSRRGEVMAWYKDEDNNDLYEVYIGQDGGVKANPNSSYLFTYLTNSTSIKLTNLDTSDVTDMEGMFEFCNSLTGLDVSNFDTSKVTNMNSMFCLGLFKESSLISLNVSNFDTSNVTSMNGMFGACTSLTSLDVSNFNTSKVTDMLDMFNNCSSLSSLDLSSFDTSNVTDIGKMFARTTNLTTIYFNNANFNSVSESCWGYDNMFTNSGVTSITVYDESAKSFIEGRLSASNKTGVTVTVGG